MMARNYSAGDKWVSAVVGDRLGPLSYKCDLPDGRIIKRHQDQIYLQMLVLG